ncbi:hypothetical protein BWQ96_08432 [Gracilariopsis chorda]|uniref:Uncharacterized protein n=1 Tax=Gracilariopsis chorda TaxID=448386 RepID=A0A2V3IIK0_9FLOR|nr:hypothetical protein BWQ96_08432 [Gracilariopsis chorda]|eukprot:PXF41853.1 hypothetical protein BWQ96_08432 [Gracilariopsis chorda]
MPLTFVPGPTEPSDLQSFLGPLIEELKELENDGRGTEFLFYDGKRRRVRVHMLCFTGDLPAVKKVSGIKGHNAKFPCRYCVVSGVWSASHRHYYFPSYIRTSEGNRLVFDPSNLPLRTESQSRETIYQLSQMRGQPKAQLQTETGINEGSVLFDLPNIVPYRSFPIDIMHLFYNIGKDIIRAWISSRDQFYSISKMSLRAIDLELVQYGNGVSSQLGCCPRPLSRFAEWKSAEVKEFILSYSLVVLDGYLPDALLSGWRDFVEVVDICWRTVLTEAEVGKLHVLCLRFYEHFEQYYFRGDVGRVNMCKYTLHLLLHLAECVAECEPPLYYSQYWMERYIGWILSHMNARNLAFSSLFNNAKFVEAYKLLIRDPHETDENQTMTGDYEFRGQCYQYIVGEDPNLDDILSACLKSYLIRKYDCLTSAQALQVLEGVHEVGFRSRFCFYSENKVQNATTKLVPATLHNMAPRRRENSNVACEMENRRAVDVYYGRLLMLFDFKVDSNLSERWQHWQQSYNVALLDWVSGLEAGTQGQVYKRGRSVHAFGLKTVEDIAIISRLISVVDHVVPSGSSQSRGRHQCYFIDERRLSDNVLRNDQESLNGSQKVLRGMRGENVTFRHT